MNPEFSAFINSNSTAVIIVLGILAAIGLVQWRKVRVAEAESELKQAMLEKGVPVEELNKAAKINGRRGMVDQFGGLSGGAKAGIIIGSVLVSIVAISCLAGALHTIAFVSARDHRAYAAPQPPVEVSSTVVDPRDAISGNAFYLDLQPVANQKLTDVVGNNGHTLAALPQKRREFGGVPFQIGPGYIRLQGKNRPELPGAANDIRVGCKFDKLHILHATEYGAFGDKTHPFHVPEGTEIGRYRVRYSDETEQLIPIVYGEDVRDSWNWDRSRRVTRGKVVWTGKSAGATKEGVTLRLYLTSWTNPRPEAEVTSIDFVSACDTAASPFCVALTTERTAR